MGGRLSEETDPPALSLSPRQKYILLEFDYSYLFVLLGTLFSKRKTSLSQPEDTHAHTT